MIPYWNQLREVHGEALELFTPDEGNWGGIGVITMLDSKQDFLSAAAALEEPLVQHRKATVPHEELCQQCLCPLSSGEEILCAYCAAKPHA